MLSAKLKSIAKTYPAKTAVVCESSRISYQALVDKSESLGRGLKSLGIKKGDCVAVLLPNCPEFIISFYAITGLGAIVLPLNHLFKSDELAYYFNDSQIRAVITDSARGQLCSDVLTDLKAPVDLIVTDNNQSLTQPAAKSFDDLILPPDSDTEGDRTDATEVAIYQYSSGSTGRPKRISRTQQNLCAELENFAATANVTTEDKILCVIPLYHAHGLGNCLLAATCHGATLVILAQTFKDKVPVEVPLIFKCSKILDLIEQEKVTIFPAVPYIFNTLAETPTHSDIKLDTLRLCFSAGNFLSKDIFTKFLNRFEVPIRQLYGCTEAGSIAINLHSDIEETWNSVGKPLKNVEIQIVDETNSSLKAGEVGEVLIKSGSLTNGYHNMPDLNQQAFLSGAFLTGDLGRLTKDGSLYITGRKKILIDTGGRKVDPIEIEDVLLEYPKIKDAVVVGISGSHAGEIVKAVLVLNRNETCTDQEVFAYCKDSLAAFKVPKVVEFRDEIPKSPLGKVLRKALV